MMRAVGRLDPGTRDLPLVPGGLVVVLVSVAVASVVRWALGSLVQGGIPFVLYLASVAASTHWSGWRAGVLATVLASLAGAYLFAQPAGSLAIVNPRDVVSWMLFIAASVAVIAMMMAEKRNRWRALEHERRLRWEQEERAVLERELEESRRLESLGRLSGGVAHDFNNLLTVVLGSCELLRPDRPGDETLAAIELAARRGSELTRQLLSLARRQVMQLQPTSPNGAVEEVLRLVERLLPENINFEVKLHPEPWLFEADPVQVQQLLLNIVTNARDALPGGGIIGIQTDNVTLDESFAHRNAEVTPGEYVLIRITDNGAGMSPELQRRIFEPFFTTKEGGKGTGLGLAVAYGVVKQLRGHIFVRSAPGQGSTFEVYWPRTGASTEPIAEVPPVTLSRSPLSLMLVEDEALVRRTTAELLRGLGHSLVEASNGTEALQISGRNRSLHVDALVTDVVMPGMSGRELARQLREARPGMGVVFLTGYSEEVILEKDLIEPGVVLVKKPFTSAELDSALREVTRAAKRTA